MDGRHCKAFLTVGANAARSNPAPSSGQPNSYTGRKLTVEIILLGSHVTIDPGAHRAAPFVVTVCMRMMYDPVN